MPRRLVLPPRGSPNWLPHGEPPGGLLYLAWGHRRFGRDPIEPTQHHGWIYLVVLSGSPRLQLTGSSRRLRSGDIALIGPDITCGWSDVGNSTCDLLVWVWKQPPALLKNEDLWIGPADPATLALGQQLHALTRREIAEPDAVSARFLSSVQMQLDAAWYRARLGRQTGPVSHDARMRLATEWMLRHLDLRDPLRRLADYLAVSPTTLQRWFRDFAKCTPRQAFNDLKLTEARRRLAAPSVSIKQVALDLGYRNPGDFSRAYRRHFGHPPSASLPLDH